MPTLNLFAEPEHRPFCLEGGRPAVLLVHGFGGTPAEMRGLGDSLHQAGWTARGLLLPGFGADIATLPERRYGEWLKSIQDAATSLLESGAQPLLLLGYSMGAALSISVAQVMSASIGGLALIAPFWWQEKLWQHVLGKALRPFLPSSFRPLRSANLNDSRLRKGFARFLPGADLDDPETRRALREFRIPLALIEQLFSVSNLAYEGAAGVRVPVLIVQGRRDEIVRVPQTRKLMSRFPGPVQYVEVDAGHDLTLPENPAWPEVANAVLVFAAGVLPSYAAPAALGRTAA
jgi:carboxylesterase